MKRRDFLKAAAAFPLIAPPPFIWSQLQRTPKAHGRSAISR